MRTGRNFVVISLLAACCIVIIWFTTSIQGSQKTYEVRPNISIPEYKTETVRVIDAYERLMERYLDLTETNIAGIDSDIQTVICKLDSIEKGMNDLSSRITGIEKALRINQKKETLKNPTDIQKK